MMIWWLLGAGIPAALVVLILVGRAQERRAVARWSDALSPEGTRTLQVHAEAVWRNLDVLDAAIDGSRRADTRERALLLLSAGADQIQRTGASILETLSHANRLVRMVSALVYVPPVKPREFKLPEVVRLAHVGRFLHHLLATGVERLRLRLWLLAQMVRIIGRVAFASNHRLRHEAASETPDPKVVDGERPKLEAARDDVSRVGDLSMESMMVALAALEAAGRTAKKP